MKTDEIRRTFQEFFEANGHRRIPSASLVPRRATPRRCSRSPGCSRSSRISWASRSRRTTGWSSCQKVFRTPDIDNVGTTHRHLTFFEMLGNFSIGDYFKQGAAELAWQLSTEGFGLEPEKIWITVFEGDEELGLGPDQEAIDAWLSIGIPRERIVLCNRKENFWQAGETGPCGPCSELYIDRGLEFGSEDDLPGGENERFLEYWNLVFMQYDQNPVNTLTPLPAKNIDTGLGLNRLAAHLQGTTSVFETDEFKPLIELSEELSGKRYGETFDTDRAMRILADHTRGSSFLVADGVVPSNDDRGYVLRRVMRRAIVQGRRLGIEPGFMPRYADLVRELMGDAYPELHENADTIRMWLSREEETFGRTLEQGMRLLDDVIARAKDGGRGGHRRRPGLPAARHPRLPAGAHARAGGRAGHGRRRAGLRGAHERAAPRARAARAAAPSTASATRSPPSPRAASRPPSPATRRPSRRPPSRRSRRRTGACWPSSSSRRSTRPAAARSPTRA